jgi:hypothetical protein
MRADNDRLVFSAIVDGARSDENIGVAFAVLQAPTV